MMHLLVMYLVKMTSTGEIEEHIVKEKNGIINDMRGEKAQKTSHKMLRFLLDEEQNLTDALHVNANEVS